MRASVARRSSPSTRAKAATGSAGASSPASCSKGSTLPARKTSVSASVFSEATRAHRDVEGLLAPVARGIGGDDDRGRRLGVRRDGEERRAQPGIAEEAGGAGVEHARDLDAARHRIGPDAIDDALAA